MKLFHRVVFFSLSLFVLSFMAIHTFRFPLVVAAEEGSAWKAEWDRTVRAAKKEGQLNVYAVPS